MLVRGRERASALVSALPLAGSEPGSRKMGQFASPKTWSIPWQKKFALPVFGSKYTR